MTQAFASPRKYIQGYNELTRLKKHTAKLGNSLFFLATPRRLNDVKDLIQKSFADTDTTLTFQEFHGECSKEEVARLRESVKANRSDLIIGIGGGKAIDTAKAVAFYENLPVVIIPTVVSCDAPTSQVVIFYNDIGQVDDVLLTRRNPDLVLVDTNIIAHSPVRLLVAGMGDALSTYFEARTCVEAYRRNLAGGNFTLTSYALAKLCYETLLTDGLAAKLAVENKSVSQALDHIIEANTLLSGLGFENNGVAAAHAIYDAFMTLPGGHKMYHGEWVAFGTIVLLILENRPQKELKEVIDFCRLVGLPTTLKDLGMENISSEDLLKVAQAATSAKSAMNNEPFAVTPELVVSAIKIADAIGRRGQA